MQLYIGSRKSNWCVIPVSVFKLDLLGDAWCIAWYMYSSKLDIVLHDVAMHCIVKHFIALRCVVLHCIVLYRIVLFLGCIVLHLHCIVLYCIALYYIALYCIVPYTYHIFSTTRDRSTFHVIPTSSVESFM